jgi:hypothetical protein
LQYLTPPEHADMTIKEQALARVQQPGTPSGRYRAPDSLLTFLNTLLPRLAGTGLCRAHSQGQ